MHRKIYEGLDRINSNPRLKPNTVTGGIFVATVAGILTAGVIALSIFCTNQALAVFHGTSDSEEVVQVASVQELEAFRDTEFSDWMATGAINDLQVTNGQRLELKESGYQRQREDKRYRPEAVRDPQGYIQTPVDLPENALVCSKIVSHTAEIDFATRLNNKLQVITGDGDDQAIALKLVTNASGRAGQYQAPDPPDYLPPGQLDPHVDDQGRFILEKHLPTGEAGAFVTCLAINAPRGGQSQEVKVELVVLDGHGNVLDLGPMPKWTVNTPTEINGTNRFSIGLIDSRNHHPSVDIRGFCAIEMSGSIPTAREREECRFP